MKKIKLERGQQFKISTIEELKKIYEYFKDDWDIYIPLEDEIESFNSDENLRYIVRWADGDVFLAYPADDFETIPNPFIE